MESKPLSQAADFPSRRRQFGIRFRKSLGWLWHHRKRTAFLVLLLGFLVLNFLAFMHAHAMTHFAPGGTKTDRPESLTLLQKAGVLFTGVRIPRPENEATPARLHLPFTTYCLESDEGIVIEAWRISHPRPHGMVLMFHGYASCKANLLGEAQAFHELGYTTFLVDFRGSGGSSGSVTTVGVDEANDVAWAVTYVHDKWPDQPIILYGQSMGSAAILRAVAVKGVRPLAVVIECPFDRLLSTVQNRFRSMDLPAFPAAQLLVFWGGIQHGFNGFRHNPVDYARDVRCPVLLLQGDKDPRVTREQAESIFENLGGQKQFEAL
jgi:alpha-beta hydrolase superfamily lysophospholipase